MPSESTKSAAAVVEADLAYVRAALREEWRHLAGRRLLLTGGAGFLGYYLTRAIAYYNRQTYEAARVDLTVYDNFARGVPTWLRELERRGDLRAIPFDMRAPLRGDFGPYDYIVHAASIGSPARYVARPLETIDANVVGLRSLLDYAVEAAASPRPVRGLLFLSSSEVYGDPDPKRVPTVESYRGPVSCTGPRACYAEAKRFGETLCAVYAREYGVATRIARPFDNYGPGLTIDDGRVLSDFARDVLSGRDVAMLSDGSATRTFCYAADAVVGYYKVLVSGRDGEPYNIGADAPEISIGEIAERLTSTARALLGYAGKPVYRPSADSDCHIDAPTRRCPSIAKARRELGYEPRIALEDGLERSLIWYRENHEGAREASGAVAPRRTGAAA